MNKASIHLLYISFFEIKSSLAFIYTMNILDYHSNSYNALLIKIYINKFVEITLIN